MRIILAALALALALAACGQPPEKIMCGGFIGRQCPSGLTCVDDPTDGCDPANGAADCPGVCQ